MKVRVLIKQTEHYYGTIDLTEERFLQYQKRLGDKSKEMGVISVMLMKGLDRTEEWDVEVFQNLSGE